MPKRTYQPSKKKKSRKLGFRSKNKDPKRKKILKRRMAKGRKKLSA
jgi:large subunit ribosomal protein L34